MPSPFIPYANKVIAPPTTRLSRHVSERRSGDVSLPTESQTEDQPKPVTLRPLPLTPSLLFL